MVGAFISEEEKRIKYDALENGNAIIQIKPNGFHERYKPGERDLIYCAKGQILEIGFRPYSTIRQEFNRQLCLEMNELAKIIAENL